MAELFRYAAFISYSSKDARFAARLHKALESYVIPKSLGAFDIIGGGKRNRIYPVFRDREELSAGDLGDRIEAALKASSALIVVCSPNSAASPWVQKEIDYFVSLGRRDRIFAIIDNKAPDRDEAGADATALCFPPAFRGDALADGAALEPLAADARRGKDGFRNAWLKIVAGLIGVGAGALQDRDRARERGRRLSAIAAVSVIALGGAYLAAWIDARNWRNDLSSYPEIAAAKEKDVDATTYAVAGAGNPGLIVPARGPRSDEILRGIAATKSQTIGSSEILDHSLSADGRWLVVWNDKMAALYDRASGKKLRDLGKVSKLTLSESGGALVTDSHEPQDFLYYDLRKPDLPAKKLGTYYKDMYGFVLSANGASLAVKHVNATASFFDLAHGEPARALGPVDLGRTVNFVDWEISHNGATLVTKARDDAIAVFDLTGARPPTHIAPLPKAAGSSGFDRLVEMQLSANGRTLAISNADHGAIYDLVSGRPPIRLGKLGRFHTISVSDDGAIVMIETNVEGSRPGSSEKRFQLYDSLAGGPPRDLGAQSEIKMSKDGKIIIQRTRRGELYVTDRARETVRAFSNVLRFDLSANGTRLLVQTFAGDGFTGADQTWSAIDLAKNGEPLELPGSKDIFYPSISPTGAYVVLRQSNGESTAYDLGRADSKGRPLGISTDQGSIEYHGANDSLAVTRRVDGATVLFDLAAPSPALDKHGRALHGAALARSVCASSGVWLAPFRAAERSMAKEAASARTGDAARVHAALVGRPWNPCDWRGLLSGPEGWTQAWRRFEVAVLGRAARDYKCGEINAAGAVNEARLDACRLAGIPEPDIVGPDIKGMYDPL